MGEKEEEEEEEWRRRGLSGEHEKFGKTIRSTNHLGGRPVVRHGMYMVWKYLYRKQGEGRTVDVDR